MITTEVVHNSDGTVVTGYMDNWESSEPLSLGGWIAVFDDMDDSGGKKPHSHDALGVSILGINGSEITLEVDGDNTGFALKAGVNMSPFTDGAGYEWGRFQLLFEGKPLHKLAWTLTLVNNEPVPSLPMGLFVFPE